MEDEGYCTLSDVLGCVEWHVKQCGSARALAAKWGVSCAYISDVRKKKREPGPSILTPLGLRAVKSYQVVYKNYVEPKEA